MAEGLTRPWGRGKLGTMEKMDEKKALAVLKLGRGASPAEIRRAFRQLAKQYHPDRWEQDPQRGGLAEGRMKEINRAWQVLKPRLSGQGAGTAFTGKRPQPARHEEKEPGEGLFRAFLRRVKKTRGAGAVPRSPGAKSTPFVRGKRRPGKQSRFAQVLEPLCAGEGEMERREGGQGPTPMENYRRHMALKRQVNARKRASRNGERGPVSPVSPVKKVGPFSR